MNPSSVLAAICQEIDVAKTVEVAEPQGRTADSCGSESRGTKEAEVQRCTVDALVPERGAHQSCAEGGTNQVDEVHTRRLQQQAGVDRVNLEVV